ncbi:MAG: tRNA pseudouridine(38-40) synthase TruA [Ignavibacteriales bacterium CG18_big_fil_WC_8_21_14_2_50_31_20]|nr:MAG: tRNA pseudouridine(38-40) synthase TruA [Ignavibacteriales bacterium CG18_big_fil_WC_8_21_14_2_50_31_20]
MKNYRLTIQYSGKNYSGWQIQPNVKTVQGEIVKSINTITGVDVNLIGSGRTDSGVHALGQVANFKMNDELDLLKLKHSLNSLLPTDIAIIDISEEMLEFHSRFDAQKRSYLYLFTHEKSPFYSDYSYHYKNIFNIEISNLNEISKLLVGEYDFTSFSRKKTDAENMVCNIAFARWKRVKNFIIFRIDANRFLHGMVRTIVGTVLQIAEQNLPCEKILEIINQKSRNSAGRAVSAKGLFLLNVKY